MNGNSISFVSRAPHIKHPDNNRTVMADVLIALIPAAVWGVYAFGIRTLLIIAVSVIASLATEAVFAVLSRKYITLGDLSAAVTGVLLAMCLPVTVPLYVPVIGAVFAVGVVKCAFGGLGGNFLNPAISGFVFLKLAFPRIMGIYLDPLTDTVTGATPLLALKEGLLPEESLYDILTGNVAGAIGEVSTVLLFAGGIYLIARGIVSWHIPTAYIVTVVALAIAFPQNVNGISFAISEAVSGGLFLGAFFMATDPVTTPITNMGKFVFGVICGAVTVLLRFFGPSSDGVAVAILFANMMTGVIDRFTLPRRFRDEKSTSETEAAE